MRGRSFRVAVRVAAPAFALAAAGLAAACAESPTSPAAPVTAARPLPSEFALPAGLHLSVAPATDTLRQSFTITPGAATVADIGGAVRISLAANAACDPARSAYGPGTWDQACAVITQPLTVTAKAWRDAGGQPRVQFSPDLRFSPATRNVVWVATKSLGITADYRLDWCPSGGGACVNERLGDPAMVTYSDPATGVVARRIKHFSGYTVVAE